MSDLLDQLASSGHAHGLSFERLDVLEEVQASDYWVAPLQIEVMGSYSALRMWLDEWLGQMRLLRPSGLRLDLLQHIEPFERQSMGVSGTGQLVEQITHALSRREAPTGVL